MSRFHAALFALILLVGACSSGSTTEQPTYNLTEFAIEGPASTFSDSKLAVTNSGELPHTLVVADETGHVVAATDLIQPGQTVEMDLSLSPGKFQFTCRIVAQKPDGELVDHYEAGMNETIEVER